MSDTIYLEPDVFMALGLSAAAHGGFGCCASFAHNGNPLCPYGHAKWLDGGDFWDVPVRNEARAGLELDGEGIMTLNDSRLKSAGVTPCVERVRFAKWCRIVGVDVAA